MAFDSAPFSAHRPRRLRSTPAMRDLVAETRIDVQDLVAPLFVQEYAANPVPISSLPGVVQHTVDSLRREVNEPVSYTHLTLPTTSSV